MIKAVIFDCFGVILTDALQAMADEASKKSKAYNEIYIVLDEANRGLITRGEADKRIAKILKMPTEEYVKRKFDGETRNEPLLNYIENLRREYKTAMLSNVSNGGLLRRFHVDELNRYFDVTVASAEIGFAKPEAQAYEITADKLGVRLDECVFIDDRAEYCEGATAVGIKAVKYESFSQLKIDLNKILADS